MSAESFVVSSADVELAANDGAEQGLVVRVKQVEAAIAPAFLLDGLGELVEFVPAGARVLDCRKEFQIAPVGRFEQFAQGGQAVDGLLHRGPFGFACAVAVFYLAVVLEKGQIVDRCLDPENEAELDVQLDRNWPHGMLDPRTFAADAETIPHFALVLCAEIE